MQKPPARILIVDDDRDVRHAISARLQEAGFEVTAVASGEDALLACVPPLPDVIILDVCLPGMDGYRVCERIRAILEHPISIVFLTGTTHAGTTTRLEQLVQQSGGDYFIAKPYDSEFLIELINRITTDDFACQST